MTQVRHSDDELSLSALCGLAYSGNIVGCFNEVALRQAPLVLGWVTVFGVRTGKEYFTKLLRPTQPPTLSGTGNEYQPKCAFTPQPLRLWCKGKYSPFHLQVSVWVACRTA